MTLVVGGMSSNGFSFSYEKPQGAESVACDP